MGYNYEKEIKQDALNLAENLSDIMGKIADFKNTLTPDQLQELDNLEGSGEAMKKAKENLSKLDIEIQTWEL